MYASLIKIQNNIFNTRKVKKFDKFNKLYMFRNIALVAQLDRATDF
ncbi:MAG: hypothetical protein WC614_00055 [bacterium]